MRIEGVAYELAGVDHVIGRLAGEILFPDDPLLSPRHANFFYRGAHLYVRDEGSHNGVFIRLRAAVQVEPHQPFLVGKDVPPAPIIPPGRLLCPRSESALNSP